MRLRIDVEPNSIPQPARIDTRSVSPYNRLLNFLEFESVLTWYYNTDL
jgi:hypothetical protein